MTASHLDLFAPSRAGKALHPNFVALRDSPYHSAARGLMNDLYSRMGDPNGGFLGAFQTEAFHARLFELACFAYVESAGLSIDRSFDRPDFLASRGETTVAFEATTANPPGGGTIDLSVAFVRPLLGDELTQKVRHEFPRRMRALLRKKLGGRYHELSHCAGRPLVLLIAPFFEPGAVYYSDEALVGSLYGHDGTLDAFFPAPGTEAISAVAYCNQFTVPRFFRLATTFGPASGFAGSRSGTAYRDLSAEEFAIVQYQYELGDPSAPVETWWQGVTLFENPWAAVPLPQGALPCTSTFRTLNDDLVREVSDFHPVTSFMLVGTTAMHSENSARASST